MTKSNLTLEGNPGFRALRGAVLSAAAVASMAMAPVPAMANATASAAASVDTTVRAPARLGIGEGIESDRQFQTLFASWKTLDNSKKPVVPAQPVLSIPSRVPVEQYRLSSSFGMRVHPVTGRRTGHHGVDMAAPTGTPIHATADGEVAMAKWNGGYGNYVQIEHGGDMETRYGHMSRLNVRPGQQVRKGDIIGYVGSTGRSTGPHLHYEVRMAGEPIDPEPFMDAHSFEEAFASAGGLSGAGGPE